ncbi:MAG: hypothetical protein BRD30_11760 [Bacteroidetes bacterium QH_2_63_10]|nr:MAG: hypothetical protein BRD30_11760 [Bacteroidetes bacterium QH_2_63_10]
MLLLTHAAATLLMLGVILVVQLVHYPLFRYVRATDYEAFQAAHMRRITWIVAPATTTELATAGWIAWSPPLSLPAWMGWTGLGLLLFIWATTGLVQVPLHRRLTDGFDTAAHRRLVVTNWLRTGAWALRAGLALWMVGQGLHSP